MTKPVRLNPDEEKVLAALASVGRDFGCLSFNAVTHRTGQERRVVRRACRSLARKGLATYERGLWTEDGMAGSGYGTTDAGQARADEKLIAEIRTRGGVGE